MGRFRHKDNPQPVPTLVQPSPVPTLVPTGEHILFQCSTCLPNEVVKVAKAQVLANKIVGGQCFMDFMKARGLIDTNGRTPEQVVNHLRNYTLLVPIHYYSGKCSVVGYVNTGQKDVYFNRCSHDHYNACDTASNGTHEWSHDLGYTHPFNRTPTRGRTVPYSINAAFESCCSESQGFRTEMLIK